MRMLGFLPAFLCLVAVLLAASAAGEEDRVTSLVAALAAGEEPDTGEPTDAQLAAAESLYLLSESCRPAMADALRSVRLGRSALAVADWHFRHHDFEEARFFYELALENVGGFGDHPALCNARADAARYRISLICEAAACEFEPLCLYADAVTRDDHIAEREELRLIREAYPASRIIDDVDFKIGTTLYPRDRRQLAAYWETFLARHPPSPLCDEVERRLTIVYLDLGLEAAGRGERTEAEMRFLSVLERPALFEHDAYARVARFFEQSGDLAHAEWAYVKGLHLGRPEAHQVLALFYERHHDLTEYVRFLMDSGADESQIRQRLAEFEEMREYDSAG